MPIAVQLSRSGCVLALCVFLAASAAHSQTSPAHASEASAASAAQSQIPRVPSQGNAMHGKQLYRQCTSCHAIDENDIGPKHRGVVGRKAGTAADYAYSSALKSSGIVWDEASLNRWLANPSAMVPGTKMYFLIKDPQDRADIIAYLSELR